MSKQLEVPDHLVPALERMLAISASKRNDYSRTGPWANFRDTSEFFGLANWQSAVFNQIQKLSRVRSLSDGRQVMNEPLEDTLLDNANYALFAYAMYLEQQSETANIEVAVDTAAGAFTAYTIVDGKLSCCGVPEEAEHHPNCQLIEAYRSRRIYPAQSLDSTGG